MEQYLYKDLYDLEESHWWHKAKRRMCVALIARFAPKRPLRILDIGCGTGKNVETFAQLGESWGVDISPEAIAFCKKRGLKTVPAQKPPPMPLPNSMLFCDLWIPTPL